MDGVRDILSTSHKYKNVEIIAWALCIDYINLNIVILPKFSKSRFMVHLLENSLMIYDIQPELQSKGDKSFWAIVYYHKNIGIIIDEAIKNM